MPPMNTIKRAIRALHERHVQATRLNEINIDRIDRSAIQGNKKVTWKKLCGNTKKLFFFEILVCNVLIFLRFDLENFGLERSGTLVAFIPPIFVKNAWCGAKL